MALKVEELRDEYMDRLLDRITEVRYPSKELLDRAENLAYTPEQAERLVRYLIATVENARYPSHQLMDRVERILFGIPGR
ncbi:MAG: hypothetical protein E6G49_07850 [Actinobacteria bacterium]|jgi:hypothetical protein|nr:MAG: hypothetical protein E6G49_07850 [Actinomycetota bacterium]